MIAPKHVSELRVFVQAACIVALTDELGLKLKIENVIQVVLGDGGGRTVYSSDEVALVLAWLEGYRAPHQQGGKNVSQEQTGE